MILSFNWFVFCSEIEDILHFKYQHKKGIKSKMPTGQVLY